MTVINQHNNRIFFLTFHWTRFTFTIGQWQTTNKGSSGQRHKAKREREREQTLHLKREKREIKFNFEQFEILMNKKGPRFSNYQTARSS